MLRISSSRLQAWMAVAIVSASIIGCGESTITYPVYPVSGKIVFGDGQAAAQLAGGFVELASTDTMLSSRGEIQKDGSFRLGTYAHSDGTPVGRYRVLVEPPFADEQSIPVIDERFQAFETSGMEVNVEAKENQITITVERAKR